MVDDYHGTSVADPYRWLEDGDAPEVVEWVAAQNAVTRAALDGDRARALWHGRLVDLLELPQVQGVQVRGDHVFCWERPVGAQQSVVTRRSADDPARPADPLLDPAGMSADATTAIDWFEASPDGELLAVGLSDGGTEDSVLRLVSGVDGSSAGSPGDAIPDTRACSVAWEPDGSGFFYTRYPHGDQYHRTVHHHAVGDDWTADPVVWAEHPDPQAWPSVDLSSDGRWLLVTVSVGWGRTDVHLLDRSSGGWTTLIAGVEAITELGFSADGKSLVGLTTYGAGRGRIVRRPLGDTAVDPGEWETLVGERDDVIKQLGGDERRPRDGHQPRCGRRSVGPRPRRRGPVGSAGRRRRRRHHRRSRGEPRTLPSGSPS